MTELKTIKDWSKEYDDEMSINGRMAPHLNWTSYCKKCGAKDAVITESELDDIPFFITQLRVEAIKWMKESRNCDPLDMGSAEAARGMRLFIVRFFNISDEELK